MKLYTFSELDFDARQAVMLRVYAVPGSLHKLAITYEGFIEAAQAIYADTVPRYSLDGSYGWPNLD